MLTKKVLFIKKAGDGLALNFGPGHLPLNADSF